MSSTSTFPTNLVKLCFAKKVYLVEVRDASRCTERLYRASTVCKRDAGKAIEAPRKASSKPLRDALRGVERPTRALSWRRGEAAKVMEVARRAFLRLLRDALFGDFSFVKARGKALSLVDALRVVERVARSATRLVADAARAVELAARSAARMIGDVCVALDRVARGFAERLRDRAFSDFAVRRTLVALRALADIVSALERLVVGGPIRMALRDAFRAVELAAKAVSRGLLDASRALDVTARSLTKSLRALAFSDFAHRLGVPLKVFLRDRALPDFVVRRQRHSKMALRDIVAAIEAGFSARFRLLCAYVRTVTRYDALLAADHNAVKAVLACALEKLKKVYEKVRS